MNLTLIPWKEHKKLTTSTFLLLKIRITWFCKILTIENLTTKLSITQPKIYKNNDYRKKIIWTTPKRNPNRLEEHREQIMRDDCELCEPSPQQHIKYHGSHTEYGYNPRVPHLWEKRVAIHLKKDLTWITLL